MAPSPMWPVAACVAMPLAVSAAFAADRGDFIVSYEPSRTPILAEIAEEAAGSGFLEEVADELNARLALPHDVAMVFAECGEANAFYIPDEKAIAMCYELVAEFAASLAEVATTEAELDEAIIGATYFFLFHELGHALIDVLALPAVGREEDAVDQLAAVILLTEPAFREDGADAVIATAVTFARWAEAGAQQLTDIPFYGEHSLDAVRFYNLLCWAYGSDTARFEGLVGEVLPESRAARCPGEFQRVATAWENLLAPHMK